MDSIVAAAQALENRLAVTEHDLAQAKDHCAQWQRAHAECEELVRAEQVRVESARSKAAAQDSEIQQLQGKLAVTEKAASTLGTRLDKLAEKATNRENFLNDELNKAMVVINEQAKALAKLSKELEKLKAEEKTPQG
jgi:chromosome segregation ATPase